MASSFNLMANCAISALFLPLSCLRPGPPAYRGQGWYLTRLKPQDPYPNGRTPIHFGGAGQRITLYAGAKILGHNAGGYNEFVFDITDADENTNRELQLAILCDDSRDLHTIPSDASDFHPYGELYRHLRLVYVPGIAIEMLHIHSQVTPGEPAR